MKPAADESQNSLNPHPEEDAGLLPLLDPLPCDENLWTIYRQFAHALSQSGQLPTAHQARNQRPHSVPLEALPMLF